MSSITYKLVLASQSPRRRDLLTAAGYDFRTAVAGVNEELDLSLDLDTAIQELAIRKAKAVYAENPALFSEQTLVLAADTLVVLDGQTLGKPESEAQAFEFLKQLSGRGHQVKTAICLMNCDLARQSVHAACATAIETSDVYFRKLSDSEIRGYIATGEPLDKAGAYGIQGFGGAFIQSVSGRWDNVMGLSIELMERTMKIHNWSVPRLAEVRLNDVRHRMLQAKPRTREPGSPLRLVAVSKTQPVAKIEAALRFAQRDFGENYVQELCEKAQHFAPGPLRTALNGTENPVWHLIGPLQTNKVKNVIGLADLIHSVDRIELAREISKRANQAGIIQKILVQIKLGDEETKHGILPENAPELISDIERLPNIQICGLMALPPQFEDKEGVRPYFRQLRSLRDEWRGAGLVRIGTLDELSMGTSDDFEIAIEEGATLIRVGTLVFGERKKEL